LFDRYCHEWNVLQFTIGSSSREGPCGALSPEGSFVRTSRHLTFLSAIFLVCGFNAGCSNGSSSTNASGAGGTPSALEFTSPVANPTLEVANPPQTVNFTVNQSAKFSLQSGCGRGKPVGTLSNATSTTVTYTAPSAPVSSTCVGSTSASQQDTVVATSTGSSPQTALISVIVVQTSPVVISPTRFQYPTCPNPGTVISLQAPPPYGVAQIGVYTSLPFGDQGYQNSPPSPNGVAPFTWQMTGSLPTGLSLVAGSDSSNELISGTPGSVGCYTFTLQATDATGVASPPASFSLVVVPASLKVQASTVANSYNVSGDQNAAGVPYVGSALSASGGTGPYTWTQVAGTGNLIPVNVTQPTLGSNVAILSGTPAAGSAGPLGTPFSTQLLVSDSQSPYPATQVTGLSMNAEVLPQFCTQASGGYITPSPTVNGGSLTGGNVPTDSYMQGSWAFLLRGFDASGGPVVMAGSVTLGASNGQYIVTGGEEDITNSAGSEHLTINSTGSSYTLGVSFPSTSPVSSYSHGCMTLANSAGTTTNFAFTVGGCSNQYTENQETSTSHNACGMAQNGGQNVAAGYFTQGRVIEFDCMPGTSCAGPISTQAPGILRQQDTASFANGLTGSYAFGLSGRDYQSGRYAVAGSVQAGSGNLTSAAADIDDAGTLSPQLTGGSGTFTSIDANGYATATLTVGGASYDFALYQVGTNDALLATTDTLSASHPILSGEAITTATSFSHASMQNSHIFHIAGITQSGPDVSVGVLSFDGVSSVTGTVYEDQAGTLGTTAVSAGYQIDANTGRAELSTSGQNQTLGAHPFVAYVIPAPANLTRFGCSIPANCVTGFLVGTDSTAQSGVLEFQTPPPLIAPPPPFNNQFLEGDYLYGTDEMLDSVASSLEGDAFASPSATSATNGSLGTAASNGASGPIVLDVTYGNPNYCLLPGCYLLLPSESLQNGSYSINANGTGSFGGLTVSVTNGDVTFYIDESPLNLNPSIIVAQQ